MKKKFGLVQKLGCLYLLVVVALLLSTPLAFADDCKDDLSNLQDCMRTGTFREAITVIAVLLGTTPVVIARMLGVSEEEIARLINRDWWSPETEMAQVIRHLTGRSPGPAPEFRDLPGDIGEPGRTLVDRIYDGTRAKRELQDLGILEDLRKLNAKDPQYRQKLDQLFQKVKAHKRLKGIALDYDEKTGKIDVDDLVIILEEPEYRLPQPPPPPPSPPPPPTIHTPPPAPPVDTTPPGKPPVKITPPDKPPTKTKTPPDKPPSGPPRQQPITFESGPWGPRPSWGSPQDEQRFKRHVGDQFRKRDIKKKTQDGIDAAQPGSVKDWWKKPWKMPKLAWDAWKLARATKSALRDANEQMMHNLEQEASRIRGRRALSAQDQERLQQIRQSQERVRDQVRRLEQ